MQVRDHVLYLLPVKLVAEAWHHVAPLNNALPHVLIRRSKAAGEIFLLVEIFQPRAFIALGKICRVAVETVDVVNLASSRLLLIQSQFGIGHGCRVLAAARQQPGENRHQKNGRYQSQMTIMSCSAAF